jgi:alpha-tubulin suppressor-like RCC1 family protein
VQIGTGFDSVSAGFGQSFALRGDELWGWGENAYGQLGDGGGDRPVPVPVR